MVENSLKTERRDDEEHEKNPPKFLKLNSINGATNSLANVLPVDQTPTPTKIIKLASELFPAESNNTANTVTAAKSENTSNSSQPNPFDKSFKQSTSQSPENGSNSGNEPVIQELENVDQNMEEDHDGDHEFVEEIVDEEEIEEASEKFKRPEPVGSEEMIQVSTTTINSIAGQEGQAQPQFQMLPTASGQMLVQIPQPVASPANNFFVPAGGNMGGQLIMGSGGQIFMTQPQVMQIQDPNTGAIQHVSIQPQQQFVMTQQVDNSNAASQKTATTVTQTVTSSGNVAANPPPYTQCVMVSPQIQFVASPQPVVIPSSQQMIINQNGQQFQIVNTNPSIPQGAQIIQTANGTQLIQTQQKVIQQTNGQKMETTNGMTVKYIQSDPDEDDSEEPRRNYTRPSYTHRPSINGLSNVVHLSKESLRAIEEAGADCSSGKRGGPRLNYDELDPKRRRFLERNRMAAARCRERKKQWIISLEYKANELKEENKQIEDDCLRHQTQLAQMRAALERHHCSLGANNSIDKENNVRGGVQIKTIELSDEQALKLETAISES